MASVIIGMDPHKRSVTIEVMNERENVLLVQRFGTDRDGFKELLRTGRRFPDRTWAVEGCNGIGRHVAQRLVAAGEPVVDVPPKLSARTRVFSTGNGRKTDPVDAHSIALAALRTQRLRVVEADDATVALRLLVDRRDELGVERSKTINQIHRLLLELLPGGAKKSLSAAQARDLLAAVRPRDIVGRTRRQLVPPSLEADNAHAGRGRWMRRLDAAFRGGAWEGFRSATAVLGQAAAWVQADDAQIARQIAVRHLRPAH